MPLFSVVIPLYNKEPHIKKAIDSVLAQEIQDFEIIVVDDGSTDKSAEVVKSFTDSRIRLIRQKNAGVSAARNKGIKEAKSDLVAFLDADDEWTPCFLNTVLRLRRMYQEAGAYATAYEKRDKDGKITKPFYQKIPPAPWEGLLPSYFLAAAFGEMPIAASAICVPKEILLELNGFQEGIHVWEDSTLWGKIGLKYKIAFSQKVGAIYSLDSINRVSRKKPSIEEHPFKKIALEAIKNKEVQENIIDDLKEYITLLEINFALRNIKNGNRTMALRILPNCKPRILYFRALQKLSMSKE